MLKVVTRRFALSCACLGNSVVLVPLAIIRTDDGCRVHCLRIGLGNLHRVRNPAWRLGKGKEESRKMSVLCRMSTLLHTPTNSRPSINSYTMFMYAVNLWIESSTETYIGRGKSNTVLDAEQT
jgi:hypothetical protein